MGKYKQTNKQYQNRNNNSLNSIKSRNAKPRAVYITSHRERAGELCRVDKGTNKSRGQRNEIEQSY